VLPTQKLSGIGQFGVEGLLRFADETRLREFAEFLKLHHEAVLGPWELECLPVIEGALWQRLGDVARARTALERAEAWARREGAPIYLGRALLGLAELEQQEGSHETALETLDDAGELLSRHGARMYLDEVIAKKEILKA